MIIHIARNMLILTLRDARFIFIASLILIAFITNGLMYAEIYHERHQVWREAVNTNTSTLAEKTHNLQLVSNHRQLIVKPPSALAFIADSGEDKMPNLIPANSFRYFPPERVSRDNPRLPLLPSLDWQFIVGIVFGLLAIVLSFDAVCGAKRDGVLRLILSNSISRISIFLGIFAGYFLALAILFVAGALLDVVLLHFAGALPLEAGVFEAITWACLISLAMTAFTLGTGMAVSTMVKRSSVALVILMLLFTLNVVALPGVAQLLSAGSVNVATSFQIEQAMEEAEGQVWRNTPSEDQNWNGDPDDPGLLPWGAAVKRVLDAKNTVRYEWLRDQLALARNVSSSMTISPYGLLGNGLQQVSGTGAEGFRLFFAAVVRYVRQFARFVEDVDRADPDSPHVIYSWGSSSDSGTFSTKPVALSSLPRIESMWDAGGLLPERQPPLFQTAVIIALTLAALALGFAFFLRYDPR